MTVHLQRFCPLCDRAFQEGEAVLRCEGCGVMHHPGCWVTNNSCATQTEHKVTPIAQAYTTGRPIGGQAPHPGEGTRVISPVPPADSPAQEPVPLHPRPLQPEARAEWPVIGGQPVPARVQRQREGDGFAPPVAPRRYVPPHDEQHPGRKPLPKIYNRHRIVEYWYVPVAALVAIAVALGVIWGADQLFGGGDDKPAAPAGGITPAATVQNSGATTPAGATTPRPSASASPASGTPTVTTGSGKFKAGDTVVVTGAGDCLNVRVAPGRTNAQGQPNNAIVCLNDGTEVKIVAGPETAGDLKWWKVSTTLGEGWAAEDYLVRKP